MFVRFWGVRGSYPVPGPSTARYGGHTACVELRPDDETVIIVDAGTGIRPLGKALTHSAEGPAALALASGEGRCHVLVSHTHWDHIQGLPFFAPLYTSGNVVTVYGQQREVHLSRIFASQSREPYASHRLDEVKAHLEYRELVEGASFELGPGVHVSCARLNHPYVSVGYRIECPTGTVAYVSDTSPFDRILLGYDFIQRAPASGPRAEELAILSAMRTGVVALCRDADLVIYDTMFEPAEYEAVPHWGHSTPDHALDIVEEAGARSLALFHHNPSRSDDAQDQILARVVAAAALPVIAAREGMALFCNGEGVRLV